MICEWKSMVAAEPHPSEWKSMVAAEPHPSILEFLLGLIKPYKTGL